MLYECPKSLVLLVGGLVVLVGCTNCKDEDPSRTSNENESEVEDVGADNGNEGGFQKPDAEMDPIDNLFDVLADEGDSGADRVYSHAFSAAEHMAPNNDASQTWLYEGEKALFRYAMIGFGSDEDPVRERGFRVYMLVNFEPVPFGVIEASEEDDQPFPDDEVVLDHTERTDEHVMDFEPETPFGMSIVVDPEHLESGAANEVRLVLVEDVGEPDDFEGHRVNLQTYGGLVHYQGETPVDFDIFDEFERNSPNESPIRQFLISLYGSFVEAADADLTYFDEWDSEEDPDWPDLSNPFVVGEPTTTLRGWMTGDVDYADDSQVVELDVYLAKYRHDTGEFENLGVTKDLLRRNGMESDDAMNDGSAEFELDVELEPGIDTGFTLIAYMGWFEHDEPPPLYYARSVQNSPLLWVRYDE